MKSWRKLLWLVSLGGMAALVFSLLPLSRGESEGTKKARVLSTVSVTGEIVPCG